MNEIKLVKNAYLHLRKSNMVGNAKLKGYFYQDILSAYLVAKEIYNGELESVRNGLFYNYAKDNWKEWKWNIGYWQ